MRANWCLDIVARAVGAVEGSVFVAQWQVEGSVFVT